MRVAGWWGLLGTTAILVEALVRLVPRALGPLLDDAPLAPLHIAAYVVAPLALAYGEGYRGFQRSFVPRAVARASAVHDEPRWVQLLAPLYCMALIRARRRRLIANWLLLVFIVALIITVRMLPEPWRAIVDAAVVAGLGWGTLALVVFWARTVITGQAPDVDLKR